MNELPFHAAANLTRDPELRITDSGQSIARVGLAITPRRRDRQTGEWRDGTPTFLDGVVWGAMAEHVAQSLRKGQRVIVLGRLVTRVYTPTSGPNAGQEQRRLEVAVDEIGASLRWAEVTVTRSVSGRADEPPADDQPPF